MRAIASLRTPIDGIHRLMTYVSDEGTYLFLYEDIDDGPCIADELYDSLEAAQQSAAVRFAVGNADWTTIPDPIPGAQHDWIRPTQVKRNQTGAPLWGQFESLPSN